MTADEKIQKNGKKIQKKEQSPTMLGPQGPFYRKLFRPQRPSSIIVARVRSRVRGIQSIRLVVENTSAGMW